MSRRAGCSGRYCHCIFGLQQFEVVDSGLCYNARCVREVFFIDLALRGFFSVLGGGLLRRGAG